MQQHQGPGPPAPAARPPPPAACLQGLWDLAPRTDPGPAGGLQPAVRLFCGCSQPGSRPGSPSLAGAKPSRGPPAAASVFVGLPGAPLGGAPTPRPSLFAPSLRGPEALLLAGNFRFCGSPVPEEAVSRAGVPVPRPSFITALLGLCGVFMVGHRGQSVCPQNPSPTLLLSHNWCPSLSTACLRDWCD